jgi:hypothetical protein
VVAHGEIIDAALLPALTIRIGIFFRQVCTSSPIASLAGGSGLSSA